MNPVISFMSANFVARELSYRMTEGWMQGDSATHEHFRPVATFGERFEAMLGEIKALGFGAIDLWGAHLHYTWATPEHVALAKGLLEKHGLRVVSYAAWVPGGEADLRTACRLCRELGIPLIGGYVELVDRDRAAAVRVLREFGIVYGYENHPETSAEAVLAKIGATDDDVIGLAVDTGWFGTHGVDTLAAVRQLAPRVKHIHLKDVKARRAEKTGFTFIDMGHETCRLGTGVVPVEAVAKYLVSVGYRGAMAVEHEPEDFDPRPDCAASLLSVREWVRAGRVAALGERRPLRIAVAGCGNIAGTYGEQLAHHATVQTLGAFDLDESRARGYVEKFGGKVYPSLDAMLADREVDAVVNLTIHHAHPEVITRCLEAGKHVHSEKPLAMTFAECTRLADLADARGLRLSAAPVVWLGETQQTLWRALRRGMIGAPRAVFAEVNWGRIESWHPNPAPFYEVGPVFDVAVYPITTLTTFFGPVRRVSARGGVLLKDRKTKEGVPFSPPTPDYTVSTLEFDGGVQCRLTCNFYVGWHTRQKGFEIHGDLGSLATDTIYAFDSVVQHAEFGGSWQPLPLARVPFPGCEFARGVTELADALHEGRPHRTTGRQAAHVVDVMAAILESIRSGAVEDVRSDFPAPKPCAWAE
jgi:predicted dehydrogenase/sugar phosphate isomerase/epimerase